jgi:predicted PurR-regulated permease PerM
MSPSEDPSNDGPGAKPQHSGAPGGDLRTAHLWHLQPVRDLLVIAAVAGTVYAGYAMRTVTVPLLIALALAYLVEPIVVRMAQWRRIGRPAAVGIILLALAGVLSAAFAILVPLAIGQTLSFARNLNEGRYDGTVDRMMEAVPEEYREEARYWTDRIIHPRKQATEASAEPAPGPSDPAAASDVPDEAAPEGATGSSTLGELGSGLASGSPFVSILGAGAGQVYSFGLAVLRLGLVAFLIPFYFYYFSVYWPAITAFFMDFIPDEHRPKVSGILDEMDRAVAGFVRGRIVICVLMGVMFAIGWQVCGVPYGIALGLLTGAFSIVPYLGGIGLPFAVGLLMADQFGMDAADRMPLWAMLTWPTVVFVVVQSIEGYLLTPVIAGKATNLDPVTIVVAILAGGSVAGVYGMLLAIPIAACGKIAAKRLLLPRIHDWARGRASDPLPLDHR